MIDNINTGLSDNENADSAIQDTGESIDKNLKGGIDTDNEISKDLEISAEQKEPTLKYEPSETEQTRAALNFGESFENSEPITFPLADDEFTAKNLEESFPLTDDEFTAKNLEQSYAQNADETKDNALDIGRQASISDIDDRIPQIEDVNAPIAVEIPDDDDEQILIKAPEKKQEVKIRPIDNRFDFLELFVFTLVAVLILTTFIFRHSIVDGGSMERTLFDGEHLIISDFFYTPKRGDIIVFQDYSKAVYSPGLSKPLVKRVIAVGGDTVRVYRNGKVYVNDMSAPIYEEYTYTSGYTNALGNYEDADIPNFTYYPDKNYPEYIECTVPDGEVFVMGDHRDASTDSREFGTVSCETILGRVLLRFYPFESFGKVE